MDSNSYTELFDMPVLYRQAKRQDINSVAKVFAEAIDDLDKRHGFYESPTNPLLSNPLYEFMLSKVPEAFWVAEDNTEVIGYSISWIRASFWFLMDLFILPSHQGAGIGRRLIEKTQEAWSRSKINNRALITLAYNPSSISLYTRFGLYPREPLYFLRAQGKEIRERASRTHGKLDLQVGQSSRRVAGMLARIDRKVLGFPLDWHHEFFLEVQRAKCLILEKDGKTEGYGYVREKGGIGPLAVLHEASYENALSCILNFAAEQDVENVRLLIPGANERAIAAMLKHGLRIVSPMLFMSSKPVGFWPNYLCYSPGLM